MEPAGAVEPKEDREGEANRRQKEPVGQQCQESGYNGGVKDKTADIDITFPFLNLILTFGTSLSITTVPEEPLTDHHLFFKYPNSLRARSMPF
ncbi:Hypothetical protein DEACI_0749 [Acididesulfobacillus acetoxydans]|uniref:Uncharacterized protein n=1 Tax=Acididesulfobacillus acetoxydans TaxID=1561005 RepID=A0A8S0W6R7_9FIRM|nr:Hypothetical protein DEACI_0749 [Acididesulfobacillus acetoxydans]CEJ07657.1 Hypothetical protein DEACI_2123 [Acididesulfobacillus acetoxydans]